MTIEHACQSHTATVPVQLSCRSDAPSERSAAATATGTGASSDSDTLHALVLSARRTGLTG